MHKNLIRTTGGVLMHTITVQLLKRRSEARRISCPNYGCRIQQQIRRIIRRTVTLHPEQQKLNFTGQHYAVVARYFMFIDYYRSERISPISDIWPRNTNEFDRALEWTKEQYSETLLALGYFTHVLPLSCKDAIILRWISLKGFHQSWILDGWNDRDHIIQPARDAVLDYYKVRPHNISSIQHSQLKPIQSNLICLTALRRAL